MAFYINLDSRADRKQQFEDECSKMDICVERFPALRSIGVGQGCTLSHIEVLKLARERKYPSVIIFEDDFEFLVSKEEFHDRTNNLPLDYDVVMLSYSLIHSEPYNEQFGRVLEAQTASGYIVNSRFYDILINTLEEGYSMFLKEPHVHWIYMNDQYWKRLQPVSRWYYSLVRLGKQRVSYSDLAGRVTDYGV
jgi:glycosyl transferase family 25